ncbi:AzlD domain-containing protein [Mammaliicoccus stepanovicii]|uniref:Branched-chain amino acid transport family protein n=1 Tax=Mammaliicoccus stepanovicii TaxID=643214 RepID=A0A239X8F3_9STAP|nr:AzlD domain-containing protein [Mammaliicoccus stepanovicii]PNZ77790.1 AzlD domain-containing protein [Mammaliicoccus stepanovicii]GGI42915.1 branched-chain amino acid transporter [Mammaliicoccus stepanovicii]SNV43001.1 branched-chain amino acid transport family protein [Mammaliicoccus stepanovicii]
MTISIYVLLIIAGCFLITWIIRVSPFIFLAKLEFPSYVIKWLEFVPVCLFTALIVEGMLNQEDKVGYILNLESIVVAIPTLVIAIISRSLTITVLAGIVMMAIVRMFI